MRITCTQQNLARGIGAVKSAVPNRPSVPILTHVLLDGREGVRDGHIRIAATDLALSLVTYVPASVEELGAIAVPARVIGDFVSTLPQEPVALELDAKTQTLEMRCGRMNANVKGSNASEFPDIPDLPKESVQVELEAKGLKEMLDRVVFAAATDDSRPVLKGVLAKFDQRELTLGAADGFRLSIQRTSLAAPVEPFSVIIPVKAIAEVAGKCGDQADPIKVAVSPNRTQVRFSLKNGEVISQVMDGSYPDLARVVPKFCTSRAVVSAAELLGAAKMVSAFVERNGTANGIRLDADPVNGRMLVMGAQAERGDGLGDVDAQIEGPPFKAAFQVGYLLSLLERIAAPQVSIEFQQDGGEPMPVAIRPVGDDTFVHVMMPLVDVAPRAVSSPAQD
jgi:DNA polymerase III subunit beta